MAVAFILVLAAQPAAYADPDDCTVDPDDASRVLCSGDQGDGIESGDDFSASSVGTLDVDGLTVPIRPPVGVEGIDFRRTSARDVNVNSGLPGEDATITTTGARGIYAESRGTPATPVNDPFLGIPIPGTPAVSGGVVTVDNHADITTSGDDAHGISALSDTRGYPGSVTSALEDFDPTDFSFAVTGIVDPDTGVATLAPGKAVAGELFELVDLDGDGVLDENPLYEFRDIDGDGDLERVPADGGTFTLNADGTFTLDSSTISAPAEGARVFSRVRYEVAGVENADPGNTADASGALVVMITGPGPGDPPLPGSYTESDAEYEASFTASGNDVWGVSTLDAANPTAALPNTGSYVAGLLERTGAGGSGNSVTVTNNGVIATTGEGAFGIVARSRGANGGNGRDASIIRSSTRGGNGNAGGAATVRADGTITTQGAEALGVFVHSVGGVGGQGGDSGWTRNAKAGGRGGDGGVAQAFGDGAIVTSGSRATGIYVLSEGGNGGGGGDGSTFNSADDGGGGGGGGTVTIDGGWTITTEGNAARGIWARSTGGKAGGGGDGGWTGTASGDGGQATGGGTITVNSSGSITTNGNDAQGIFAQSVGGFGGDGGSGGSIFFASGGDGSSAGSGGDVTVTNSGSITTRRGDVLGLIFGTGSHGIYAQSVGGGGGNGGSGRALVGFGGGSASGGHGGDVAVTNTATGTILTEGINSRGIYAQSVGGGGGDGGDSGGLVAIGGQGSGTSAGGTVTVSNDGRVETRGLKSDAIYAQSVGGAGGDGGSSAGLVSIGGSGGGGGNADTVDVTNNGQVLTLGDDARGIYAQSIGGGGGNGGDSIAFGVFGSVAIGGSGAAGGDGAAVTVTNNGTIETVGDRARGIYAQSAGGGGGNGGYAVSGAVGTLFSVAVGKGGPGAGGGAGKRVDITSTNDISTRGKSAQGIFAQSLGGSGGSGGWSIAVGAGSTSALGVAIGGKGGAGGAADEVTVTNSGSITTGVDKTTIGIDALEAVDDDIIELLRDAGYETVLDLAAASQDELAAIEGIDGADTAEVDEVLAGFSAGTIAALRNAGIQSVLDLQSETEQSLAGISGISAADAQEITEATRRYLQTVPSVLLNRASVTATTGDNSHGIEAISQGGGGGSGGFSIAASGGGISGSVAIGGSGGAGGDGASVTVANTDGTIVTGGDNSHGIFGQSLGGGGGNGGFSIAGAVSTGASLGFSLGGSGGVAGIAELVEITNSGDITTLGGLSHGIFGQSLGGGGGNGGFAVAATAAFSKPDAPSAAISLSIGGEGGDGNQGGDVEIDNTGRIDTFGAGSDGIRALSQGGGGGNGGFAGSFAGFGRTGNVSVSLGGGGGDGTESGDITVLNSGAIATRGSNAYGIYAKSLGGGGGDGGFGLSIAAATGGSEGATQSLGNYSVAIGGTGGDAGFSREVTVENSGSVSTLGARSSAIYARSLGGGGGDGGFSAAGTLIFGGTTNVPQVGVSIGGAGGDGGYAGDVDVTNAGILVTAGNKSSGIDAKSEGGGGGDGGIAFSAAISASQATTGAPASIGVAVGGAGGEGNTGGDVTVRNCATQRVGDALACDPNADNADIGIYTGGSESHGIRARSLGGGGGDGGAAISVGSSVSGPKAQYSLNANVAVGGGGGTGESAGTVTVENRAVIVTGNVTDPDADPVHDAHGIYAESLGGGGGNGGASVTFGLNIGNQAGGSSASGQVSVGGGGGDGGMGGVVDVFNLGAIHTLGESSRGIWAKSKGGGGGDGGMSISGTLLFGGQSTQPSHSVAVGGGGGDGNTADAVTVFNSGVITTAGKASSGIVAESIGGGGGDGGMSITGNLSFAPAGTARTSFNTSVSVGGAGGDGNTGGTVTVRNCATELVDGETVCSETADTSGLGIFTNNVNAHGILARSIGGGGGDGGMAVAAGLGIGGDKNTRNINVSVGVGGAGGDGSTADTVTVENRSNIITGLASPDEPGASRNSHGIWAQSIGGGGGNGGATFAGSFALQPASGGTNLVSTFAVGGGGGDGNHGGVVDIDNVGNIATFGHSSQGIWAQSIGGGGGNGGEARALDLVFSGSNSGSDKNTPDSTSYEVSVAVGGDGGGASNGDAVFVDNTGSIETYGASSRGIWAQSIGGGGGNGGGAIFGSGNEYVDAFILAKVLVGAVQSPTDFFNDPNVTVGGSAGSSGDGSTVRVNNVGDIRTFGLFSHGVSAQSIGGGGGESQMFVEASAKTGSITADRRAAGDGVLAEIVRFTVRLDDGAPVEVVLVGDQTNASVADLVDDLNAALRNAGLQGLKPGDPATLVTASESDGRVVLAATDGDADLRLGDIRNLDRLGFDPVPNGPRGGDAVIGVTGFVGVGGGAGASGDGGEVRVDHAGDIETWGAGAYGIKAQSIGGGGGTAGSVVRGATLGGEEIAFDFGIGAAFARPVGGGGDGNLVEVFTSGDIVTHGDDSHGIFAQSVGGGGGMAGSTGLGPDLRVLYGSVGGAGDAGDVVVEHAGSLVTEGLRSHGIFAQSAGGEGLGGDVTVTLGDADAAAPIVVTTSGANSDGILVQSRGGNGIGLAGEPASNGNIAVTIAGNASVAGGADAGAGVRFVDGLDNTLTNYGRIMSRSGPDGLAVAGGVGTETIYNYGTIDGAIDLDLASNDPIYDDYSGGPNVFSNEAGGVLNAGAFVDLGGGLLNNAGVVSPGGDGAVSSTLVTADYLQGSTGTLAIDANLSDDTADFFDVNGTMTLGGGLAVNLVDAGFSRPGSRTLIVAGASGGIVDDGVSLLAARSEVLDTALSFSEPGLIGLRMDLDFAPKSMRRHRNQKALGEYINTVQSKGGADALAPFVASVIAAPDAEALDALYTSAIPRIAADTQLITLYSSTLFTDAMLDCGMRGDGVRFERERQCSWMNVGGRGMEREATAFSDGFEERAFQVAGGAQYDTDGLWIVGGAFSIEDRELNQVGAPASGDGYQFQGGLVAKYGLAPLQLSASLSGGYSALDSVRLVGKDRLRAESDQAVRFFSGRFGLGHTLQDEALYVRSGLDLGFTRVAMDGYTERGDSGMNLRVADAAASYLSSRLAVEFGYENTLRGGALLRPTLGFGVTRFWNDSPPDLRAAFVAVPAGSGDFAVASEMDRNFIDVGLGLDVVTADGIVLRFSGRRQFADRFEATSANLEIAFRF